MRLILIVLAFAACAKKPAPQNPQVKANATGTTEAAPDTKSDGAADAPSPAAEPDSHTRGPMPKGGAGKTGGDPCEGGQ